MVIVPQNGTIFIVNKHITRQISTPWEDSWRMDLLLPLSSNLFPCQTAAYQPHHHPHFPHGVIFVQCHILFYAHDTIFIGIHRQLAEIKSGNIKRPKVDKVDQGWTYRRLWWTAFQSVSDFLRNNSGSWGSICLQVSDFSSQNADRRLKTVTCWSGPRILQESRGTEREIFGFNCHWQWHLNLRKNIMSDRVRLGWNRIWINLMTDRTASR